MTDTPQASGADLARQALAAARANAKNTPAPAAKKPRPTMRPHRGEHADPQGLAGILGRLTAEQGWTVGLEGGSVIDQWPTLCPQYDGSVQPVGYDETTGRLTLRPSTHAYAAQLRLLGGQLARQINDKMGKPVVRTIRVLPVGNITATERPAATQTSVGEDKGPARTRETACDGYKVTREALLAHRGDGLPANPYVRAALERQEAALTDLRNREPETAFTDAVAELERVRGPELPPSEQARRAALAYKRNGGDAAPVRRAFDVA